MTFANRKALVAIAALLALAVVLVWPAPDPAASALHTDMYAVATHMSHDHADRRPGSAEVQFDCGPCGIGCCMMTVCHPLLATDPYGVMFKTTGKTAQIIVSIDVRGNAPDVAVPPPRLLSV